MMKPKVACFRYRKHNDVYVSNMSFSTDVLLSILDDFPDRKIIVLIETDVNCVQILSLIGKNNGIEELIPHSHIPRFLAVCDDKTKLHYLLKQVDMDNIEGLFIADIKNDIIPEEFICSLDNTVNSMVKNGVSDISLSVDFSENQMVISLPKEKYKLMSVKDKISSIFGD